MIKVNTTTEQIFDKVCWNVIDVTVYYVGRHRIDHQNLLRMVTVYHYPDGPIADGSQGMIDLVKDVLHDPEAIRMRIQKLVNENEDEVREAIRSMDARQN